VVVGLLGAVDGYRSAPLVGGLTVNVDGPVHGLVDLVAPHDPDLVAAVCHDRGDVVGGRPGTGNGQDERSAPCGVVASNAVVDVNGIGRAAAGSADLCPGGPQRACRVLVDRHRFAGPGGDRGGEARIEGVRLGTRGVAEPVQPGRAVVHGRDGARVRRYRHDMGCRVEMGAVPQHVGQRVGAAV